MTGALVRALRLTMSPHDEWQAISAEPPHAPAIIALYVLPLALIPAASWSAGMLLSGANASSGAASEFGKTIGGGLLAYAGVVLSICLCAASIVVLAPLFACRRDWLRALQVAAYSAAPLLLGGVLLVQPNLAYALILPFFHGLYLQYAGLHHLLAVKEGDAAEYVALINMLLMIASTAIGATGMWLGIL